MIGISQQVVAAGGAFGWPPVRSSGAPQTCLNAHVSFMAHGRGGAFHIHSVLIRPIIRTPFVPAGTTAFAIRGAFDTTGAFSAWAFSACALRLQIVAASGPCFLMSR